MSDLKNCPFCGSEAIISAGTNEFPEGFARCQNYCTSHLQFALWNTRADTAELAALRAERDQWRTDYEKAARFATACEQSDSRFERLMEGMLGRLHKLPLGKRADENLDDAVARLIADAAESKRRCGELEQQRDIKHHALHAARCHLEYCGYGDEWERDGTDELKQQISEGLAIGAPSQDEKPAPSGISDEEREKRRRQSRTHKARNAKKPAALTPEASK